MKSQFYREVSNDNIMRRSSTKQKHKKQSILLSCTNSIKINKANKSETKSLIKSIDLNRQVKNNNNRMLRMSFSKPFVQMEQSVEVPQINQKSVISVCCQCQGIREKYQKEAKAQKMHYQQEKTTQNHKFIQMEKKFLLKESQYINLSTDYRSMMHQNQDLKQTITELVQQNQDFRQKIEFNEQQIVRINQELKKYQDQNKFFNHFLTAFVQQTKNMLAWCQLFENNYEQLPRNIDSVREQLTSRKVDLDVILKQSISYQQNHFGVSSIKDSNNSSFFDSEQDGTESFMKYFNQNNNTTKTKYSKVCTLTEMKAKTPLIEAMTVNKQNINTMNKLNFQDLIHSRINKKNQKQKTSQMKDDLLRMMLIQAKSIENANNCRSSRNSKSHIEIDGSVLSSIRKRVDHYVQ